MSGTLRDWPRDRDTVRYSDSRIGVGRSKGGISIDALRKIYASF